mgnify:CR=1 FL=1
MPDIADFVDNKIVVEDTKPDKKNEEPPKKDKIDTYFLENLSINFCSFGVLSILLWLIIFLHFFTVSKEIEENKKYNETEYPPLLEQYEEKVNIVRLEYLKQVNETHSKIAKLF